MVGYEWLEIGLQRLRGIEPHEVMQVLTSKIRKPVSATGPDGHPVLTIWGRTHAGRPLIVGTRQLTKRDRQIIGAREMRPGEIVEFEAWEAARDE
jgi:hypothetical protein